MNYELRILLSPDNQNIIIAVKKRITNSVPITKQKLMLVLANEKRFVCVYKFISLLLI